MVKLNSSTRFESPAFDINLSNFGHIRTLEMDWIETFKNKGQAAGKGRVRNWPPHPNVLFVTTL